MFPLQSEAQSSVTKTTLDDLMATLGKLEEDASFDKHALNDKNQKPLAWRKFLSLIVSFLAIVWLSQRDCRSRAMMDGS